MTPRHHVGIIRFPGTNCDLDTWEAISLVPGLVPVWVSHKEKSAGDLAAIILPGGFSYGDYFRTGAIAARSPVMDLVGVGRASEMKETVVWNLRAFPA